VTDQVYTILPFQWFSHTCGATSFGITAWNICSRQVSNTSSTPL